jgi:hypothetical protein
MAPAAASEVRNARRFEINGALPFNGPDHHNEKRRFVASWLHSLRKTLARGSGFSNPRKHCGNKFRALQAAEKTLFCIRARLQSGRKRLTMRWALQAAEKARFLKGTGFSSYVTTVESMRL